MYVSVKDAPVRLEGVLSLKGVSATVLTLGWVSLITDVSSEMVAAVLPLFVMFELGLSPVAYGTIDAVYQGGSTVARVAGGYLGDVRAPKWVAAAGYAVSAACKLLLVFASSFGALFAVVWLDRCGKGLRTAPRDAMIAQASHPDMLGRAFGLHRTMDTLGALLGPLVAWLLLLLAEDDFVLIFLVSFCLAIAATVLIGFLDPDTAPQPPPIEAAAAPNFDRAAVKAALTDHRYLALAIACAALSLSTVSDGFLYLILLRAENGATAQFPLFSAATNIGYLVFALPVGNIADQLGRPRVFLMGYTSLLAAYLACGLLGGMPAVALGLLFLGLHYATTDGMLPAIAAPLLPQHLRATGLAVLQSVTAVGKAAGAALFGVALAFVGPRAALSLFAAALGVAILGVAALLRLVHPQPP